MPRRSTITRTEIPSEFERLERGVMARPVSGGAPQDPLTPAQPRTT